MPASFTGHGGPPLWHRRHIASDPGASLTSRFRGASLRPWYARGCVSLAYISNALAPAFPSQTAYGSMLDLLTIPEPRSAIRPRPAARMGLAPEVAVIGCGYWGRNLVRVFHGLRTLRSVCEPAPTGIESARQIAPEIPVVSDF